MGTLLKSPSFLGDFFFFCQIQPYVFCPVPSGGGNARRCRPSVPCCTLGRRRCTKVSPKRVVLHPRATKMYESVAQACRAVPSGDEDVRKCRSSAPCCTLGRRKSAKVSLKRAVLHSWATISVVFVAEGFPSSIRHSALRPWATKMYESVAQACRAAPSGDEDVRKCCPSAPRCTLGRRRCTKVLPKRAVLHPWATIKYESVAQGSRAAPSGDEDVRKCRPREPCCTLGRRRCTKVSLKRAVLHSWATISVVFVAEGFPSSIRHSALRPWAMGRRGRVA